MRYHHQLPGDKTKVSGNEEGQLLLLGPLVRLAYDQYARVTTKSMSVKRENVVSSMRWPSVETRWRMLALLFLGGNLFIGNFQQKLQEEVARREILAKSEFRSSDRYRPRPQAGECLREPQKGEPCGVGQEEEPASHLAHGGREVPPEGVPTPREGTEMAPPQDCRSLYGP